MLCVAMLNIVGERDPTWDLPAMFWLHNVPSAHSFPFVKQDRSTCRRYMRTVYWQNDEQEQNGTYLTLSARQSWTTGQLACSSISTSNPSLFPSCTFEPRSVTEDCSTCCRMDGGEFSCWLDRSAHIERLCVCVKFGN